LCFLYPLEGSTLVFICSCLCRILTESGILPYFGRPSCPGGLSFPFFFSVLFPPPSIYLCPFLCIISDLGFFFFLYSFFLFHFLSSSFRIFSPSLPLAHYGAPSCAVDRTAFLSPLCFLFLTTPYFFPFFVLWVF